MDLAQRATARPTGHAEPNPAAAARRGTGRHAPPVSKTLPAGKQGRRRFTDLYGDDLVCVRYRIDPKTGARYTTVELAVEGRPWSWATTGSRPRL